MTGLDFVQIALYLGLLVVCTPVLGSYMARVFRGERNLLSFALRPVENGLYRIMGVNTATEQDWKSYAFALILFNGIGFVFLFALQLVQGSLPLNPAGSRCPPRCWWTTCSSSCVAAVT